MKKVHNSRLFDDMDTLNELLVDCRRSLREIADASSNGKQKVWRKIKKLEDDNVVWGYSAVINESKIGWELYIALVKIGPQTLEAVNKVIEGQIFLKI